MSQLTMQEFIDEMVTELEERIEGHFQDVPRAEIEVVLEKEIRRLERDQ